MLASRVVFICTIFCMDLHYILLFCRTVRLRAVPQKSPMSVINTHDITFNNTELCTSVLIYHSSVSSSVLHRGFVAKSCVWRKTINFFFTCKRILKELLKEGGVYVLFEALYCRHFFHKTLQVTTYLSLARKYTVKKCFALISTTKRHQ